MNLVAVPLAVFQEDHFSPAEKRTITETCFRPDFGAASEALYSRLNAVLQASDKVGPGLVAYAVRCDAAELAQIMAVRNAKLLKEASRAEMDEVAAMFAAVDRKPPPSKAGAWTPLDEIRAYKREAVRAEEDANAGRFGVFGAVAASDLFNRFSSTSDKLDGSTMDAGGGGSADAWSDPQVGWQGGAGAGAGEISTNKSGNTAWDDTEAAAGDQDSEIIVGNYSDDFGIATRAQTGADDSCYCALHRNSNHRLFKFVEGVGYTQLGGNGTAPAAGDAFRLTSIGNDHDTYVAGLHELGPETDSTYATGKRGLHGRFGGSGYVRSWLGNSYSAPPTATVRGLVDTGLFRGLVDGGLVR